MLKTAVNKTAKVGETVNVVPPTLRCRVSTLSVKSQTPIVGTPPMHSFWMDAVEIILLEVSTLKGCSFV
jgi:hypothetical protein